jgi:hypothetical protein
MHTSRNVGVGTTSGGLALIAAVLIGDVTAAAPDYWSHPAVIGALTIAFVLLFVGVWSLGTVYLGWPWPKTHEEKAAEHAEREHQAQLAYLWRRHALQELVHELENNRRDLNIQLGNRRTFGVYHSATAWHKNSQVLDSPELARTRELVHDAYLRTHALDQRTRERYDAASHDDLNRDEWRELTEEETKERAEALTAVETAIAAVAGILEAETQS